MYTLCNSSLCSLLQPPATSSLLGPYSPQHPVLNHPQSMFFITVTDTVSHPYKTTGKIIVLCILNFKFLGRRMKDKRFWNEW
jgi:hypothetical protein